MTYTQENSNTGVLKMYGHISEWYNSSAEFTRTFEEMERKFQNITIRMHCYGGSVFEGNVIYNAIAKSKATVTIIVEGIAASMGSIILQAAHKRVICDNAFVMMHRPSSYTVGDSQTHFAAGKLLNSMEKNFIKTYSRRSKRSEEDVSGYMDGKDHWLSADEALREGFVDEVTEAIAENIESLDKPTDSSERTIKNIYSKYAAHLVTPPAAPSHKNTKTQDHTGMKKVLIAALGLTGVNENTPDADFEKAVTDKFKELQSTNATLVQSQVDAVISAAETLSGKTFDEATRSALEKIGLTAGVQSLTVALGVNAAPATEKTGVNAATPAAATIGIPKVVNLINNAPVAQGTDTTRAAWTWDDYQTNDASALEAMEMSDHEKFSALYKARYGNNPPK